ncbi:hypothetical protein Rt10032_c13g4982 [Rhodotorula toruloides]|uniref:Uncharacterized protein n=1 Tax=Rhodotorula toruloides TaxID=5286 RepID=A0A511KM34_RHOTO|nr:hypothetical protein Rt10032_c13g4982 [Rhodotorula toruloides]
MLLYWLWIGIKDPAGLREDILAAFDAPLLASQDNTPWLKDSATRLHSSLDNSHPYPQKQLRCFENLFYVSSVKFVEGSLDKTSSIHEIRPDGPVWDKVGGHLSFNSHVNHITDELLTALLDSRRKQYIGVHISRRSSTGQMSQETVDALKAGVKQVQADLAKRKGGPKGPLPVSALRTRAKESSIGELRL